MAELAAGAAMGLAFTVAYESVKHLFNNVISEFDSGGQIFEVSQQDRGLCPPPDMPSCLEGFEEHVMELRKLVLEERLDVVGITAIGGSGKSALVTALCHDSQIQEYFKKRVIYIVVSESPDLLTILKKMWRSIVGGPEPDFANVEDAHNKLESEISLRRNEPILVVLDDVWQFSHLKEVLFKRAQCKEIQV